MIFRAFRYRLYPTPEQAAAMSATAGTVRFVYNLALEQRRDFWRHRKAVDGTRFDFVSQGREVTQLRAEVDWIAAVPAAALTFALRDLDKAFANFFSGRADYPKPRRKGLRDGFRAKGPSSAVRRLNAKWSTVNVPKIGPVRFRHTRPIEGRVVSVAYVLDAEGWHACFCCEIERVAEPSRLPPVGIDRGIANTITLSTGEMLRLTDLAALEARRRRVQRVLARRVKGSGRYAAQRGRLSRISAKIARVRRDWAHKTSTDLAMRFGHIAIEDLRVASMTRSGRGKRSLNRSILNQAWRSFETLLTYKVEERGGTVAKINPAFTSQECSACGTVDKASRKSQAAFDCVHCGFAEHADINAAMNILRRSTARAEGGGYSPGEAQTINHAAIAA